AVTERNDLSNDLSWFTGRALLPYLGLDDTFFARLGAETCTLTRLVYIIRLPESLPSTALKAYNAITHEVETFANVLLNNLGTRRR
ncbi:hypothetical protein H0H93_007354, partial [Arthromyces matolae]